MGLLSTTMPLIGRDHESRRIEELLDGLPERGGALMVNGAAGVGKSALLSEAADRARDRGMTVLSTTGVQAEANLPFAALHALLRPLLPLSEDLPSAQRAALRAVFGHSYEAAAPDRFLVALAILELLTDAAAEAPLLLIADDAHWLDRASADVLAFVARRVGMDPVVVLGSIRDDLDCPELSTSVDQLSLDRLDDEAARDLLQARFPELAPVVRERLLREAEGNPLALLELPAALSGSVREGETMLPRHLPLTERLERAFAARCAALPPVTRVLLQVAAADDSSVLTEIMRATEAAAGVCPRMTDLDPAVEAGLIHVEGPTVRFHHPLVRSAVYQKATVAERHAAHAALAEVLAEDPDRRVWHRAAAAVDRNPQVAVELEATAERAVRRGDLVTAATGYERAAALTTGGTRRGDLLLRAAEAATELGRSEQVRRLLREADALELGPVERARSLWLGDAFRTGSARNPSTVDSLVETAGTMAASGELDLALDLLSVAAARCRYGDLTGETVRRLVETTDRTGVSPEDPRRLHILANTAPVACGAEILGWLSAISTPDDPGLLHLLASAASTTGAFHLASTLCAAAAARLREQGRLGVLARVQTTRCWAAILVGDYPEAVMAAEEGARLAAETNQPASQMLTRTAHAALAALRGDHDVAEAMCARIESVALPRGAALNLALVQYVRAMSALGRGRHTEAYEQLHRVFEPADPAHHDLFASLDIGDLAEAAVHSDHKKEARALMRKAEQAAGLTPSPFLRVNLRCARALLADDAHAEAAFQYALADEELLRWPFFQARLHLSFGEWLRRQRRTAEARGPLRTARDAFDALGATPWSERARQELRAAGETSRWRDPGTLDVLTAQELQIVQMAAEGMSNREIGQRLYLSHRTVESHLYRAFPKLGITSRAQLPATLADPPRATG
ncbi:MAG TPA: AAA family ATPase [Actinocrinis sp.]|uniref:ATP-binding protein n=1 Tax=Actinocrinis sp. TaxID=1920516 RepID=UPI002DDCA3BD|nr:AAA family ATPase [Actinocrinis sp.]HEV3173334.1 AAA family ATPase [Actinocrinis sp.]